jgi:predicted enzyme related to lactoylglutathione lyase
MGIGRLKCAALDVTDLEVAEAFWSEVIGLPVIPSPFPGRFSYVGQPDPWTCELILHLVRTEKGEEANRAHIDIWVQGVDEAIEQIQAIGGSVRRAPTIYPRPGSYPGERPRLDWAVMRDPFGNEFCLTTALRAEQTDAVLATPPELHSDDLALRRAAGVTATR